MGHGIAQVLAAAGHPVALYEPELARAQAGRARIGSNLARQIAKGKLEQARADQMLDRVTPTADLEAAARDADIVVEAVFEDVEVKGELIRRLDQVAPSDTVLATNTSSISITRLASFARAERRPRVVGMHFFSPVPVMPLIELTRGAETDDATEQVVRELATEMGKEVIVSRDRPGFIVNRILMPYLAEAMRAFEEGLGTAEDIDTGARLGLNHPMGPLALADFIGLDVCLHIMEVLHEGFGQPHMAPPPVLRQLVEAGHLGQKTGRGFYDYPPS